MFTTYFLISLSLLFSDEGNISEEEYSAYRKLRDNLYH